MGYEYIFIAVAILVPLGIFSIFKGDQAVTSAIVEKKASLPGAFGDSFGTSKSKKKKPKKKTKGTTATQADLDERRQESSESEIEEKPAAQPPKRNDGQKRSTAPLSSTKNAKNNKNSHSSSSAQATESSSKSTPAVSSSNVSKVTHTTTSATATTTIGSDNVTSSKPKAASVENWKKQRQEQQREFLAKQQEPLQFASAAAKNSSVSVSSPHITSISGPGAMGNNKKKNRGNAGSGLSHAEFPTLSRPEPVAPAPKQPKQPKKAKEAVKKPEPVPEPTPASEDSEEDDDEEMEEEEEEHEKEEQKEEHVSREVKDADSDQDEWTTVNTQSRSGGIDFSKPMDPWVAQQQRQKQERIAAADPHGEQQAQFARVLSIKPTVKEDRIREAIPDGFSVQKSRTGGSSGGSASYQSAEVTKKQRENLAKAAKKKEDKAAMDAMQEKRRQEHMRQVKAEKMKEFYRSQSKKQAPYVESRWDVPKNTAPSSSAVSGGMSSQVNDKGQLIWD